MIVPHACQYLIGNMHCHSLTTPGMNDWWVKPNQIDMEYKYVCKLSTTIIKTIEVCRICVEIVITSFLLL